MIGGIASAVPLIQILHLEGEMDTVYIKDLASRFEKLTYISNIELEHMIYQYRVDIHPVTMGFLRRKVIEI